MGGYDTTWQAAAAQISRMLILLATLQKIVRVPERKFPQGNEHEPFKNEGSNSSPLKKKLYKKAATIVVTAFTASLGRVELPAPRLGGECSIH